MTDTRYEAIYTDRMKAIELMLESDLSKLIPEYTRNTLKACLTSEAERERTGSISVSFYDRPLNSEPSITYEVVGGLLSTHEDGSVWRAFTTGAKVWFPSASGTLAEVRAQVALHERILKLAESLPCNTHAVCLRTAQEEAARVAEQKDREEHMRIRTIVERAASLMCSGMRVGWKSSRAVPPELLKDVPPGTYEVVRNPYKGRAPSKKYELTIFNAGHGDLKRLS